jgi:hypothetical protein
MRKIFAGAMAFSVIGAIILGGALAWNDSESFVGISQVGSFAWDLDGPLCTDETIPDIAPCHDDPGTLAHDPVLTFFLLGPAGDQIDIAYGSIENDSDSAFNIKFVGGEVLITTIDSPNPCSSSNFAGVVGGLGLMHSESIQPGEHGGQFFAAIQVVANANEGCIGALVGWQTNIFVETAGGGPGQ